MSFFPSEFDPRSSTAFVLNLANVSTPDGDFGFIVGVDGVFTDVNGKEWFGSQLIQPGDDEFAINGVAPSGQMTLSFFQDPAAPDLVKEVKSLGSDYINGHPITFYIQPLRSQAEFYAPTMAPLPVMVRTMRRINFSLGGAQDRAISLSYESAFEDRRGARRLVYNTEDHARLIGYQNPSLEFIPTSDWQEEKLFDQ